MLIGLDFDNTIVCYDQAIALLAEELFELPKEVPRTKLGLRDHLRAVGREPEWTVFQGELYGPGMRNAQPFEGAIATMQQLVAAGHELVIISHRSRHPYAGPRHDLHEAARAWVADWLHTVGLFDEQSNQACVYFMETRDQKLAMINKLGCDVFLDDLYEVLTAPSFPANTRGILFLSAVTGSSGNGEVEDVIETWVQLPSRLRR
jgi:hypothetical protein